MDRTPSSPAAGDGKSDETCRARESSQRGQGSLDDRGAPQRGQVWAGFIEGSRSGAAASSPATAVSAARNWSIYSRSSQPPSEGYKMFLDTRLGQAGYQMAQFRGDIRLIRERLGNLIAQDFAVAPA